LRIEGQSLEQLYRAHAANAFRRARRLLGSDAEAHEVVHDVFLSLVERPEQYAGHSRMSTFLYSAITHACLNKLRDRKTQLRLLEQHAGWLASRTYSAPSTDQLSVLRSRLTRMPQPLAQLAVYYYMDELTHQEIAELMACSRRHVGDLLSRLDAWVEAGEPAQ
jgi:RNA polymerase sigma-70 factor (ECF subfamily)